MNEHDFKSSIMGAEIFQDLATDPPEKEYWIGYQRGLRHQHGEVPNAKEHNRWLSFAEDPNPVQKMKGLGYHVGLAGHNVKAAMRVYAVTEYLAETGRRGGSVKSERKTLAVRANAKKKRPRKAVA